MYRYSDVKETGPNLLGFDLHLGGVQDVSVSITPETLEAHSKMTGIPFRDLAGGRVEYLQTYQPEFVEMAHNKLRLLEAVTITPEDLPYPERDESLKAQKFTPPDWTA